MALSSTEEVLKGEKNRVSVIPSLLPSIKSEIIRFKEKVDLVTDYRTAPTLTPDICSWPHCPSVHCGRGQLNDCISSQHLQNRSH